jgi:biotin synthase
MAAFIRQVVASVLAGNKIDRETALRLASAADQHEVWEGADRIRHHCNGRRFSLCSIINARSGGCSEDCRFCAQSARHRSDIEKYETIDRDRALALAAEGNNYGVHRLSLVTSGRSADDALLDRLEEIYREIARTTLLKLCGSMGLLTGDQGLRLREMGVIRYHCNLETSSRYFPRVCTTHSWDEKVQTLKLAREAGLSLCSGGIIGMGETMDDRIDLALELRDLAVHSIPINILTPIPGTPLADLKPLPVEEILTTIALFRFIHPRGVIRLAGGRQQLGAEQYRCFAVGANGAMVGNFLTTSGSSIEEDLRAFTAMGFSFA